MSYDVNTPERQQKITQYLRLLERRAPEWKEKYRKPLEEKREKEKKTGQDDDVK